MDQLAAMKSTLEEAVRVGLDNMSSDCPESDYPHLLSMYERAHEIESSAKLGRWLGWMQACVVINSMGKLTLDDMKAINEAHKD